MYVIRCGVFKDYKLTFKSVNIFHFACEVESKSFK